MKTNLDPQLSPLDNFEQEIEDAADFFVPVTEGEQAEIEMIIAAANKTKNRVVQ
ncbi:hypothetical protein FACS1894110_20270 [Spirochaetia bacterium]|nr:hypothetical protein FACS1894110_20270 [Spirochaetia bacterium]